jgi:nicotinate-nucleotide pyrophosphorylase (carboxylating)
MDLPAVIQEDVTRALAEDVGRGDLTAALVPADKQVRAHVLCREDAVLCGSAWFDAVFRQLDGSITVDWHFKDGDAVAADSILCYVSGPARPVLSGERTALNFLQTLSGTATTTRQYVDAIRGTNAKVLDTRKTVPGLRRALKYAVKCGGGENHRMGLYDGILVKENHIEAAGSLSAAIKLALETAPEGVFVEVEVENLAMLREALDAGAARILLDNFSLDDLKTAVAETSGRAKLEASGNVELETIRGIAGTGVDYISIGGLTKHVHAVDLSMRFE